MDGYVASDKLREARDYEEHLETFVREDERPHFHLSPRVGWMNDPNGFVRYKDEWHLFYQYYPYQTKWGPMHWGHAKSSDLVRWEALPCALAPDASYDDLEGCFSGSATELDDGQMLLMYTGVGADGLNADGSPRERQTQCVAIGDGIDFVKFEHNPVIDGTDLPEGSSTQHFRDPKIWREPDGTFKAVIANLAATGGGQIVLYESDDALSWRFSHVLARNEGRYGVMWECPDYFTLDGYDVLLLSPQDMLPQGHSFYSGNGTLAIVGQTDPETGELKGETYSSIDNGIDFYATQTALAPDGRRIMVAWMQNWDSITGVSHETRIFGQMTLPRELSVRDGRLYQWPVKEIEAFRTGRVEHTGVALGAGPVALEGVHGRVADLTVHVRATHPRDPYDEFVIWFAQDERFHCSLRYKPRTGSLEISRMHAGSRRAFVHNRKCDVENPTTDLTLRLLLDTKSVEVFVNGGAQTMSMTIPTDEEATGITFSSRGAAVMDVEFFELDL